MSTDTHVQLFRGALHGSLPFEVPDPIEIADEAATPKTRITIELPTEHAEFLDKYAAYRNAVAAAQGIRLRKRIKRKSYIESVVELQVSGLVGQLSEMVTALGPLPSADDEHAMEKYAKRVVAWMAKSSK